mmetsp:Transcript_9838/g.29276  ORF Transcript_9838/g.29276 Transcript_9838/m.29276 type:complete len:99 (-) Transcript_9838:572-868(-)
MGGGGSQDGEGRIVSAQNQEAAEGQVTEAKAANNRFLAMEQAKKEKYDYRPRYYGGHGRVTKRGEKGGACGAETRAPPGSDQRFGCPPCRQGGTGRPS